ncbi:MAG: hypothetical protein KGM46_11915 [Pseudomonadota bacterium]|jgi:hypothetical protein|nr:hypothetical protein [Xanthomonadaceae bacterium]MDE3211437.1 hypothetical protein [Pseudomonadota bacterium]
MGISALTSLATDLGMLGSFVAFVVAALLAALLLCLVFRVVVGYLPSYLHAIAVALLSLAVAAATVIVAGLILPSAPAGWLAWGAALLAGTGWVDYQLLASDGRRIGYRKALLVQLIFLGICLLAWMSFAASTAAISTV